MTSKDEIESVTIRPPRRGECNQLAGTAGTQIVAVPASWKGKKIRFEAVGDTFALQFAPDATIALDHTQKNTVGAGPGYVLSAASDAVGDPLGSGQYKEFDVTSADLFFGFKGTGTSGFLMFREAETALGSFA